MDKLIKNKFIKMGIKSLLTALLFFIIVLLLDAFILNSYIDSDIVMVGIAIMFTILFSTYLIIDTIKEYCSK